MLRSAVKFICIGRMSTSGQFALYWYLWPSKCLVVLNNTFKPSIYITSPVIMNEEEFDDIAEIKKSQAHYENVNSRRIGTCCFLFSLAFVLLVVGDVYPFWTLHQGRNYHYDQYASYGGNSDFSKLVGYVTIVSLVLGAASILVSLVMVFGSFYPDIREYQHIAFRINVAIAALGGVHALHACVIFLVDVYAMSPSIPHNTVPGWSFYLVFASGLVELIGGWLCSTLEYHFTEMVEHVDHVDIFQNH